LEFLNLFGGVVVVLFFSHLRQRSCHVPLQAKRIVAMRQAERDIVMQKAELANVEKELEKDYVSTISRRQEEAQSLLRAWDRQVRVKELHNKKNAGRPQSIADSQDNRNVSAQANAFLS
jgi:tRNA pseudouridine-54 N-methylase